jgi:hypothetical protein
MRNILTKGFLGLLVLSATLFVLVFVYSPNQKTIAQENYGNTGTHRYEEMPEIVLPESTYISYTEFRNDLATTSPEIMQINPATWGKIIRFDTAEELYRFSLDVSYDLKYTQFETKLTLAAINILMSLDYVLGQDIDYTVMKSKQFNPIGFDFEIEGVPYEQAFKGTFDGNGFEIWNLYFSGYDRLTKILYEGTEFETTVSYIEYYAMFAYNEGTIQNLGIINPTFEYNFESDSLFKAANLVGENRESANVNHVYVIDYRSTALVAGIRMVASEGYAAGIVYNNYGTFTNAYFVGRVVVNASYGSRFSVQPVLFNNASGGIINNLAFDDTLYQETVTIAGNTYNITQPNALATSMTSTNLRNSNTVIGTGWYFYPAENNPYPKYPSTLGLEYVNSSYQIVLDSETNETVTVPNYFIINDERDLIAFSKMLNYTRPSGQTPYRELNYIITGNIDMGGVAPRGYTTPTVEFTGVFAGANDSIYVRDLHIVDGMVQESYYTGLFGILRGQVYNLIFINAKLTLTETDNYAGVNNYIGLIAGDLIGGTIRNILADVEIDLGSRTLGQFYTGGIAGRATGYVSSVYVDGILDANQDHIYRTDILINPTYHFGGVIGSTGSSALILTDAYSSVDIHGIGTTSTQMNASSAPTLYMGGVIGYVDYLEFDRHILGLLTNDGTITSYEINSPYAEKQYIGGVIGMSTGYAPVMSVAVGNYTNKGSIDPKLRGSNQVISSGVLISNHSEAVEFIHLFNHQDASFDYYTESPLSGNFTNLDYTTLVYNIGQSLTLSQSRNNMDMELVNVYNFSGVYYSTLNSYTLLRFVENKGDITLKNQTLAETTSIAGISLAENIDYLNVTYDGEIKAFNLIMQGNASTEKQLFIAGITKTLIMNRYIKNGVVNGAFVVSGITSNQTDYYKNYLANNIYVGGFVNYNNSGDMDPNGTLSMPVATMGILNSINNANMYSTYGAYVGISGHANVYAGGLVTFNDGDIQNSANMGDIRFQNTSNVDTNQVTFATTSASGGSNTRYRYGIVIGGISSAVMSSKSRIYDSANSGSIIAVSKNFARAGGILGIAIYIEIENGNVYTPYQNDDDDDPMYAAIWDSILSNTINYGAVSALTISISFYSEGAEYRILSSYQGNIMRHDITQHATVPGYENTFYSILDRPNRWSPYNVIVGMRESTEERPGINASAGGIIGYGLSVMRRMMNHGQISSTDVAGGIAGATVVIQQSFYVQIDTAINYGTVRAFDRGTPSSYLNYAAIDIMDYETIRDHFYPVDSTFIFPETYSDIRLYPENKRGFGGIFGRLQRGSSLYMYGNNSSTSTFNFIVNMDPNVDLIGRLDQVDNYNSSIYFFDFRNAVYYSARKNDTTQAVFTGIYWFQDSSTNTNNSANAQRHNYNITITSRKYEYNYNVTTGYWERTTYVKSTNRSEVTYYGRRYLRNGAYSTYSNYQTEIISRSDAPEHGSTGWSAVANSTVNIGTLNEFKYEHDLPLYNQVWDDETTKTIGSTINLSTNMPSYYFFARPQGVPVITEDPVDPVGEYVYSSSFAMQNDPDLQEFIYYAENGNLSPTFINSRPNGMYVLATSSGSTFGSILPANMTFNQLLPLDDVDGKLPRFDIDYDNATRIVADESPTFENLLIDYEKLFQTMYSDKSRLLDNTNTTLRLEEQGGSLSKLYLPTVVHPTEQNPVGTITFNLHLSQLEFVGGNATVNYKIYGAITPNNAVIAKTIEDYYGFPYGTNMNAYVSSYRSLLNDYANPNILPENKPDLEPLFNYTFNFASFSSSTITIGYITSYSEVSQYYDAFLNDNYVTDYVIRLSVTKQTSPTLPYSDSYVVDGNTRSPVPATITAENVDTYLRFNFRNDSLVLPVGTDILSLGSTTDDNITLEYYDPNTTSYVLVDYEDYTRSSTLVSSSYPYRFTLEVGVNPQLRNGQYRVGFRLLPYADRTYYTFTKGSSTTRSIEELEHYSSGGVVPSGTSIISYVNFGYPLDFSSTTLTPVIDPEAKAYQENVLYYTLPFLDKLQISDFSTITNVVVGSTTYSSGFRVYNITYIVESESGSPLTYTHQIRERAVAIADVYRNNNKVTMSSLIPVVVTREAVSTTISIDYGIDRTYSEDVYNLESDNPDAYFNITPSDIDGISFSVTNNYLVFTVDELADSGDYQFQVTYNRTGDSPISMGTVYITKSPGTNAYLSNIQFAELATETIYAPIYEANPDGTEKLDTEYQMSIYYAGIDYGGADDDGVTQFRVDGQVSNIPLDSYIPFFLNYLPLGATISRYDATNDLWTAEVDGPDSIYIGSLAADFTASEGSEDEDVIVIYRVTPENQDPSRMVYYHITVTDVTYNVSYIFDVVYEGNALAPTLDGKVIVINVRNMDTNLPVGDSIVTTLPQFTTVVKYTNTTNLFYMLGQDTYKFRFGRNKSGYFSFNVNILDPDGYLYDYRIELNGTDELETVNTLDTNSSDTGKYYYINSSTKNRTRSFVITIYNAHERTRDYGFTDSDSTWGRAND